MATIDDQASEHEERHRAAALKAALSRVTPDYERIICTGCQYAKDAKGKECSAWRECLEDYERRTR